MHQRIQTPLQPFRDRNSESFLRPMKDIVRQQVFHRFFENYLSDLSFEFVFDRNRRRKLSDSRI
jgi:hypothetical protein